MNVDQADINEMTIVIVYINLVYMICFIFFYTFALDSIFVRFIIFIINKNVPLPVPLSNVRYYLLSWIIDSDTGIVSVCCSVHMPCDYTNDDTRQLVDPRMSERCLS